MPPSRISSYGGLHIASEQGSDQQEESYTDDAGGGTRQDDRWQVVKHIEKIYRTLLLVTTAAMMPLISSSTSLVPRILSSTLRA